MKVLHVAIGIDVLDNADAMVTVVSNPDGAILLYPHKVLVVPASSNDGWPVYYGPEEPFRAKTRKEFADMLVLLLFGESEQPMSDDGDSEDGGVAHIDYNEAN